MIAAADIHSRADLATWLAVHGIVATGDKRPADLWGEMARGETVLRDDPPRREVSLVHVVLRRGDQVLMELAQELRDGTLRHRHIPPSEKLVAGETAEVAARRCLFEEVGLAAAAVTALEVVEPPTTSRLDSPSYPGLWTHYTIYTVEAAAEGLPDADFWRDNCDAGPFDPVRRHLWGWRADPTAPVIGHT
jgi:ADP-ribose pyrophosphatase YjhB (NUDIX family)